MAPVTIQLNERTMYDLDWLEDCYKRVKFPNPKCEELLVEVNEGLSHKITGELDNQVKQQALFQFLLSLNQNFICKLVHVYWLHTIFYH